MLINICDGERIIEIGTQKNYVTFIFVCNKLLVHARTANMFPGGVGSVCPESSVRLVNEGGSLLEGRVEVCVEQVWSSVCDNLWDEVDAQVVCRQLGFSELGNRGWFHMSSMSPALEIRM